MIQRKTPGPSPYDQVLTGSFPGAIGAAQDRLNQNPSDVEALALQAYAMIKIGQTTRAQPIVAKALSLAPPTGRTRALAFVAKATLEEAQGQNIAANTDFQNANHASDMLGLTYLAYADLLPKVGQAGSIKPLLQEALTKQLQPNEAAAVQAKLAAQ